MPRLGQRLLNIVLALVVIVSGAQQQMVLPFNNVEIKDVNLDGLVDQLTEGGAVGSARVSNDNEGRGRSGRKTRLIFVLQLALVLFSLAVAAFLGGLLAVVFAPMGSSQGGTDDENKVCITADIDGLSERLKCEMLMLT
ncbi:MAG: hypothetical protein Q9204_002835 [Flavoplaca sp. TL-2023a]